MASPKRTLLTGGDFAGPDNSIRFERPAEAMVKRVARVLAPAPTGKPFRIGKMSLGLKPNTPASEREEVMLGLDKMVGTKLLQYARITNAFRPDQPASFYVERYTSTGKVEDGIGEILDVDFFCVLEVAIAKAGH